MTTIYAVRCYLNGKRKFTRSLNRRDAKIFLRAARTLVRYLSETMKERKP